MAPPLLALTEARLTIGRQTLLDGIDCAVGKGDRIGLVGRNGAGKSTLLRVLTGETELDSGIRTLRPRTTVASLAQEPALPPGVSLRSFVIQGLPPSEDPASLQYRADTVLEELELDPGRSTTGLSGGEQRRVALAHTLISEPELLLLDEPTNHLDLQTILRLEERIAAYAGGLVLISHDRAFLERLTTSLWWIDRGKLRVLGQGYGAFDEWSEQVLEAEQAELTRLDRRLEVEADWLHKGVTARRKRNQGRMRRLQDLRAQRRDHIASPGSVRLQADAGERSGQLVIEAKGIGIALGGREIVKDYSTRILAGERIGLIGPNGAGKTTLLKLLTGELEPAEGSVKLGTNLTIARFDQHRTALDPEKTLWETLCPDGGDKVRTGLGWKHVVGYLGDFLFRSEQARQPVKALSGGERNRLLLARILAEPANLLILDEPTNDLDLDTLELLEETLADYPGTLLLVSHDRRFLDRLVTSTIVAEGDGSWRDYAGGYSDWLAQRPAQAPQFSAPAPVTSPPAPQAAFRRRAMDGKLQRELERLPERMNRLRQSMATIEARLADAGLYVRDPAGFAAATAELDKLRADVAAMEERWFELELVREEAEA